DVGNRLRRGRPGDARERDQAGEAARLEGSAREADRIDLVAVLVVLAQEAIAALHAIANAEADRADGKGEPAEVLGGDADDVLHQLPHPVRSLGGDGAR